MPTYQSVQRTLFVVAGLCVVSCFAMRFPVRGQDTDSARTTLASLLEQRRDVLKARVETYEALVKIARCAPEEVIAARDDLLDAEYELATNKAERIEVLKRKLVNAKAYEALMEQRKAAAIATQADVLMATARRLGVEIELVRMQE